MIILIIILPILVQNLSIAIFPGLGDDCFNPLQIQFKNNILEQTNIYTTCIEVLFLWSFSQIVPFARIFFNIFQ